jgi:hypothetical protein
VPRSSRYEQRAPCRSRRARSLSQAKRASRAHDADASSSSQAQVSVGSEHLGGGGGLHLRPQLWRRQLRPRHRPPTCTMSPGPNSSVACTSPRITSRMSSLSSTSRHVAELTPSCVADSTRQRRDPVKRNDVLPLGGPLAFAALGAQLGPGRKSEDGSPREPRVITAGALPALAVARRGRRSSCRGQPAWYYRVDVALAFGAAPVGAGGGRSGV